METAANGKRVFRKPTTAIFILGSSSESILINSAFYLQHLISFSHHIFGCMLYYCSASMTFSRNSPLMNVAWTRFSENLHDFLDAQWWVQNFYLATHLRSLYGNCLLRSLICTISLYPQRAVWVCGWEGLKNTKTFRFATIIGNPRQPLTAAGFLYSS